MLNLLSIVSANRGLKSQTVFKQDSDENKAN